MSVVYILFSDITHQQGMYLIVAVLSGVFHGLNSSLSTIAIQGLYLTNLTYM